MIRQILPCSFEDCENSREGNTLYCASHNHEQRKLSRVKLQKDPKPVNKFSEKRSKLNTLYNKKAKRFLVGKMCAVFPDQKATQVHHMSGRIGFADEWARENEITLLMDERFWLPTSDEGHKKITENPVWAWENKFSFKRVSDPIFHKKTL